MAGVITNSKIQSFKDNLLMTLSKVLDLKLLVKETDTMDSMLLINFTDMESMFGRMELTILGISEKDKGMILEDGFLQVKNLKFMKDFTRKTKSKEVEGMFGIMDVSTREISITT